MNVAVVIICLMIPVWMSCATVAPYERERLARRDMELDRNPELSSGQQHATAYREGSTGAEGASGGGCGCN